jgi:hypothetical protein
MFPGVIVIVEVLIQPQFDEISPTLSIPFAFIDE